MKTALIDASSAILLYKAGLFEELLEQYRMVMAPAVYDEVTVSGYEGADAFVRSRSEGRLSVADDAFSEAIPLPVMGQGERQTLLAFLSGCCDFIIIDDGKGAGFCRRHDIPYINALVVPRIFYDIGLIEKAEYNRANETLIQLGRYASWVIEYAEKQPAKVFAGFRP